MEMLLPKYKCANDATVDLGNLAHNAKGDDEHDCDDGGGPVR